MKFKFLIFIFLFSCKTFALLHFKKGHLECEGKILKIENNYYFSINYGSNSETRFKLDVKDPQVIQNQNFSNALIKIKIKNDTFSFVGDAQLEKVIRLLNPKEKCKIYNNEKELIYK